MSVLDSLQRAMDVYTVHTGPEPGDRRLKMELRSADISLLNAHLQNVLSQLQEANRIIGGRSL